MTQFNKVQFGAVVTDTRRLLKGSKRALLLAFLVLFLAAIMASILAGAMAPGWLSASPSPLDNLVANLLSIVITAPLLGGLALMSLRRARGNLIQGGMIFSGTRFATRFLTYGLVTTAISMVFTAIPFPFNQVLWLAVSALLSFTAYFIVDRDAGAIQAIIASLNLVAANLGAVSAWLFLSFGLALLGIITLGIAMIWIIPFLALTSAMIYRHATDGTQSPELP